MKQRLEQELGEFINLMDKEYFQVSEQDRDSIARMVIIREFLDLKADPSTLPIYMDYISTRIEHFKASDQYEAADFFERIKKNLILF